MQTHTTHGLVLKLPLGMTFHNDLTQGPLWCRVDSYPGTPYVYRVKPDGFSNGY